MVVRIRLSGLAVVALGLWGAFVPFVGPYFGFAWNSGSEAWTWSESFGTLSVAAGACATLGALAMLGGSRVLGRLGSLAALVGGAWFVIGPLFHPLWSSAPLGPTGYGRWMTVALELGYHTGIGVFVVTLAAYALGATTLPLDRPVPPPVVEPSELEQVERPDPLPVS
jgi:hypothetical protein